MGTGTTDPLNVGIPQLRRPKIRFHDQAAPLRTFLPSSPDRDSQISSNPRSSNMAIIPCTRWAADNSLPGPVSAPTSTAPIIVDSGHVLDQQLLESVRRTRSSSKVPSTPFSSCGTVSDGTRDIYATAIYAAMTCRSPKLGELVLIIASPMPVAQARCNAGLLLFSSRRADVSGA